MNNWWIAGIFLYVEFIPGKWPYYRGVTFVEGILFLKECIFLETNLNKSDFSNTNLLGTTFENCNLENSNFQDAINYRINPLTNSIKGGKFSTSGLVGLLKEFNIKIV